MRKSSLPFSLQAAIAGAAAFGATVAAGASGASLTDLQSLFVGLGITDCRIKGNVSYSGGERIYHVPGQHYYDETIIDWTRGERWFCSEADARAAGWRKSGI
jgi:hypothetical protein